MKSGDETVSKARYDVDEVSLLHIDSAHPKPL